MMSTPPFISNGRFTAFVVVVSLMFGLVSARLFQLHVLNQDQARREVSESRQRFQEIQPRRGAILDANGQVLALSRMAWDLGVDPMMVDARDRDRLQSLADVLELSVDELERKFGWGALPSTQNRSARWVELKKGVDEFTYLAADKLEIKGLYGNRYYTRHYPAGMEAAHVVGFVNKDRMPVMGIERTLDFYLKGSSGWRVREVNGSRREIRQFRVRDVEPQNGMNVVLTLDGTIQRAVEKELDRIQNELRPESASIIVSEASTGAVIAMGSRPAFDPNVFWTFDLERDLRNRAISDIYEPGSTFKIITTAGYLNEGIGGSDTQFDCATTSVEHRNRRIRLPNDVKPRGVMDLREIIQKSSNRGTALAGMQLGEERMFSYSQAFGIGSRTGIELNGEAVGILRPVSAWDHYTLSRVAIGYGVGVTPIQMHVAMSVIANEGRLLSPYLVDRVVDAQMRPVLTFERAEPKQVIARQAADEMRANLIEAVTISGTGNSAQLRNIPVAGKTGTSRKLLPEGYSESRHVGSFSGFFPANRPEYVITVVVNDPSNAKSTYGGSVAAPAFKAVAEHIVATRGIAPEQERKDLLALSL